MANFDPSQYGAIPEESFSPESMGAQEIPEMPVKKGKPYSLQSLVPAKQFKELIGGALEAGAKPLLPLEDLIAHGLNKILPKGIIEEPSKYAQFLSPEEQQSSAAQVGGLVGDIAPYAAADITAPAALAMMAPKLAKSGLARLAASSLAQGGVGAAEMPQSPIEGGILGTVGGALGHGISEAITKGPRFLANLFKGKTEGGADLTAAQFAKEQAEKPDMLKDVQMPLGSEIRDPNFEKIYESLTGFPFTGTAKPYIKLKNLLQNTQNEILQGAGGTARGDQALFDKLKSAYLGQKEKTKAAYDLFANEADQSQLPINIDPYKNSYNEVIKEIDKKLESPGSERIWGPIKSEIQDYDPEKNPIDSFAKARDVDQNLSHVQMEMKAPEQDKFKRLFNKLQNGLTNTFDESAGDAPANLKELYSNAKNERIIQGQHERLDKTTKTPFWNIYRKNSNPVGIVSDYIKPSTKGEDYSYLLEDLLKKVPENEKENVKNILSSHYLSPKNPDDEISLGELHNKLKVLNSKQRELLFGNRKGAVDDFVKVLSKYPKAKNPTFVPQTGLTGAKTMGALGAFASSIYAGKEEGHPWLGALSIPLALMGARGLGSVLRSPALRNAYMRSLLKLEQPPSAMRGLTGALTGATLPATAVGVGNYLGGSQNGS